MTGQQILDWLKSNFLIVIFAALILAAFIALPILSSNVQSSVDRIKDERAQLDRQLTQLRQTPVVLNDPTPGAEKIEQTSALINPAALEEFREYTLKREEEAEAVIDEAVSFNRKGRSVLVPRLFPDPPYAHEEPQLLKEFSEKLYNAYVDLLRQMNAGEPPSLDDMKDALIRQEQQYRNQILAAESRNELTPEELTELRELLSARRFGLAINAAENLSIYCSLDVIDPPSWSEGQPKPSPIERYRWQWDYWIIEDLLRAIDEANGDSATVLESPVKRVVSISLEDALGDDDSTRSRSQQRPGRPGGGSGQPGGPFLEGGSGGAGGPGVGGGSQDAPSQPPGGQEQESGQTTGGKPADPAAEVPRDFTVSITGRTTNPLYDVRNVRLRLVVETSKIPQVLDAIGSQNFMTVIGLELWPADPFSDLESGYVYGRSAPTSEVVLDIETVWLRAWTSQFMPRELKIALGIPIESQTGGEARTTP